ncbi:MAG: NUDIX domain-containing protein [Bacteroidia bacterium]
MKIFALNFCLEFDVKNPGRNYDFESIAFEELMGHLFKGTDFNGQKFYVDADDTEEFLQYAFDLQANDVWREVDLTVCFRFASQAQRERFLDAFVDLFQQVDAAGGLVENEKGEYLSIFNREKWTLPKGGVEWREAIEDAAVREVKEETGLETLELGEKIGETFHTFKRGKKYVYKTTHWYKMTASADAHISPQTEEGIDDVRWMSKKDWIDLKDEETYPLIRHLFEMVFTQSLIA